MIAGERELPPEADPKTLTALAFAATISRFGRPVGEAAALSDPGSGLVVVGVAGDGFDQEVMTPLFLRFAARAVAAGFWFSMPRSGFLWAWPVALQAGRGLAGDWRPVVRSLLVEAGYAYQFSPGEAVMAKAWGAEGRG